MDPNWNQLRRRHKRYDVDWNALLEIDSPDINDYLISSVVNLSRSGALIFSPYISFRSYHLATASQNNELNLIIHSPLSELDAKIGIKRYSWDDQDRGFYLGVEFKDLCEKNQDIVDGIIRSIRHFSTKDHPFQMESHVL
jgi:hypothetical protein